MIIVSTDIYTAAVQTSGFTRYSFSMKMSIGRYSRYTIHALYTATQVLASVYNINNNQLIVCNTR